MNRRPFRAFTLVELLVVIAIIAILVLLLLPAINALRESARRTMCINQMTQLVIAVQDFEIAQGHFPSGVLDPGPGPIREEEKGFHHSWTIQLLPFIEETNLYRMIDHESGVYAANNAPARALTPQILTCPSSPDYASSNYAACHHDLEAPIDVTNQGVFFLNSQITRDDLTDGSRYTLFLGEKVTPRNGDLGWMSGTRATLRNTGTRINLTGEEATAKQSLTPEQINAFSANEGIDYAPADQTEDFADDEPASDEAESAETGETVETAPKLEMVDPEQKARDAGLYVGGFGSHHPAGAVFAFGDGRVSYFPDSTDVAVLKQLANRADGTVIDPRQID